MNRLIAFFGLIIVTAIPNVGQADLIINISSVEVTTGSLATVTFSATTNTLQSFDGYELAIDIGGNGGGLPVGITAPTFTAGTAFGTAGKIELYGAGGANFDLYVTDDSDTAQSASGSPSMFSLSFDTTGWAPGSFVPVSIVANPTAPFTNTVFNDTPIAFTSNSGGVTISAVPEPTGLAILIPALAGLGLSRRRRRRRVAC